MKIINMIHAQNMGGVDQVFRDYNQALINNGNEVAIVISDNGKDDYDLPSLKKIYKLKNLSPILDVIYFLFIVYSFKPQVIICHCYRHIKWMRWIKFIIPAKTIAVNHNREGTNYKKSLNCEYVISVNKNTRDLVIEAGKNPQKSIFMPNMIRTADIKFTAKEFHKPVIIGMFSRFESGKGFDILIKAAAILKEKKIRFKLIIGGFSIKGSSYNEDTIKNLVKEYNLNDETEFVGVIKNKPEFFNKIDIFCFPSRNEAFPMVILESFLYGTPLVSSNNEGAQMIVENDRDALLFKVEDHIALAEKLEFLINNPDKAHEISKNAFDKVQAKYSLNIVGKMLQSELERIIAFKN